MKNLTRILAVMLSIMLLVTAFAGCHEKDEIAYTIGESKFTAAMYSCLLYMSATSARSTVDDYIQENKLEIKKVNYENYKFDEEGKVATTGGTPYLKHVKNEAVKMLKQYATLDAKMKEAKLELDEDTILAAEYDAYYYWNVGCDYNTYYQYASSGMTSYLSSYYAPYAFFFEPNGVAYNTFRDYMVFESKYNFYFEHLYGEDGPKAIPTADLTKHLVDNYTIANTISFSKVDGDKKDLSDAELKALKALADKYAERLNAGEKFEDIYKEEQKRLEEINKQNNSSNQSTASATVSSSDASTASNSSDTSSTASTTTSSEEDKGYTPPQYLGVFGSEETSYKHAMFSKVKEQEFGKAVVLEDTENKQYLLVVREDITIESYWMDNLRSTIAYALKQDEYDKELDDFGATLSCKEDTYATGQFEVEDIDFDGDN